MDAHSLNFDNNYFDYIICYKSLLYLNLEKSFEELNRVLENMHQNLTKLRQKICI